MNHYITKIKKGDKFSVTEDGKKKHFYATCDARPASGVDDIEGWEVYGIEMLVKETKSELQDPIWFFCSPGSARHLKITRYTGP